MGANIYIQKEGQNICSFQVFSESYMGWLKQHPDKVMTPAEYLEAIQTKQEEVRQNGGYERQN